MNQTKLFEALREAAEEKDDFTAEVVGSVLDKLEEVYDTYPDNRAYALYAAHDLRDIANALISLSSEAETLDRIASIPGLPQA